jgi:MtN3 and saliva related transmembrane protein
MNPEYIGFLAAFLTTAAYFPQMIKVLREKHTTSISLAMYSLITSGIAVWLVYGVMIDSPSLILANGLTLVMASVILFMKLRHG